MHYSFFLQKHTASLSLFLPPSVSPSLPPPSVCVLMAYNTAGFHMKFLYICLYAYLAPSLTDPLCL